MLRAITSFSARRPLLVVVLWLGIVAAGFTVGIGVFERLTTQVGTVPGSESDRGRELRAAAAPEPEELTAVFVGASSAAVAGAAAEVRGIAGVAGVSPPVPSTATDRAQLLQITLAPGDDSDEVADAVAERLHRVPGTTVAGGPLSESEFGGQAQRDVTRAELITTPVVLVLLLLVFGGLVAAGLPLLIAVAGVGGAFGALFAYSSVADVSVYSIQVATMLSVGLAVDYGLLMVNRFREERALDPEVRGAIARTAATAGRTVLFTGLTVAVALAGLMVMPDPFLRSMGLSGLAVVVIDMLAALTLLPALLALVGRRITARARPSGRGFLARVAGMVRRRPVLVGLGATAAMVVIALPVVDMRLSQGDARLLPGGTQTRQLHDRLVTHFPERVRPDGVDVVAAAPTTDPGVAELRGRIAALPGVAGVTLGAPGPVSLLRVDADEPEAAVAAIRAVPAPFDVAVTGPAASLVDYRAMLVDRLPWAAALMVLGTLLLLFLFTGSLLLPIKAVLTSVLSIGAALGAVVWVFQEGNLGAERLGGTNLTIPVLVGAIAFGLSVDYEMFLLSRVRERWLAGSEPDVAVAEGLQQTGRIITSAALLLVVVFAGFLTGGFVPIRAIGLGLVLAVALDATVVRLLLVPATMTVLGRFNWWAPRAIRRLALAPD
jgi:RND superfamily putative drug exporter